MGSTLGSAHHNLFMFYAEHIHLNKTHCFSRLVFYQIRVEIITGSLEAYCHTFLGI